MRLTNSAGEELEITVSGYEFPDRDKIHTQDKWVLNWLNIAIKAKHGLGTWTATCACTLTWHLSKWIEWLEDIGARRSDDKTFLACELELQMSVISQNPLTIQVVLAYEFRPPWLTGEKENLSMDFVLSADTLAAMISYLKAQLEQYPTREVDTGDDFMNNGS